MTLSRVDFPAPLAPIRPMREFSPTSAVTPERITVLPKETPISCMDTSINSSCVLLNYGKAPYKSSFKTA